EPLAGAPDPYLAMVGRWQAARAAQAWLARLAGRSVSVDRRCEPAAALDRNRVDARIARDLSQAGLQRNSVHAADTSSAGADTRPGDGHPSGKPARRHRRCGPAIVGTQ